MQEYRDYIKGVLSGKIITSQYIKQAVERLEAFKKRPDMYFDEQAVQDCFDFIACMRHYLGKCAGEPFILLPWQQWVVSSIIGLKWKETGLRVCREVYLQMARKQGKSALIAALSLYFLIADGEASAEVDVLATSRDQARIIFEMCQNFAKSIDPEQRYLKHYRNYIKVGSTNSFLKLFSSDASKLDGLNASVAVLDEYAAQKDNLLYSVMKSSMAMRSQPCMIEITTPQFSLESPAFLTYQMSIEILAGVKEDPTFMPFLFTLDTEDAWDDEKNWIKSNPSLGQTVTIEYLRDQLRAAKNDTTQQVPVKIKNIGIWCQSENTWIEAEKVAACMAPVNLEDYRGYTAVIGQDLGSVSDFTSITVMIPDGEKFIFKTYTFIPEETYKDHPDKELYRAFVEEGTMIITPGNCTDYNYVINKIREIAEILIIQAIYTDSWNATQEMITLGDMGFNVVPFSQAIGNYNAPTKEMERIIRDKYAVIDKSRCVLFCFNNVSLKIDGNGNCKPDKSQARRKVDCVISMCTALGGYQKENVPLDIDIFVI